jgi:hypothetical protein
VLSLGALLASAGISVLLSGAGDAERPALPLGAREFLPKDRLFPVPFSAGETLVYTIAWLKVEGGEMTLSTNRESTPDGVPLLRITLTAESNDYVSKFYPVRDRYESWVDARDFQPLRFEKHAREGRYESDELEEFDLARRIGSWREDRTPLPERIGDVISSFYFIRSQPLVPDKHLAMDLFSRGKVYKLSAMVLGKERVETEAGTFDAIKVQPVMRETESAEDRNKGKLFVWFSDDARRLPVMARTLLPIGSVTARLKRITTERMAAGATGTPGSVPETSRPH